MAITKADILTAVKTRTSRSELTNIDDILGNILVDISSRWPFLETSDTLTVAINTSSITMSTLTEQFRSMIAVVDPNDNVLTPLASFQMFLALLDASATTAVPTKYTVYNETLHVYAPAVAEIVLTVYHSFFTSDVNSIDFPDFFDEAIIEGTCFKVFEDLSEGFNQQFGLFHKAAYESEIEKLIARYKLMRTNPNIAEVPKR